MVHKDQSPDRPIENTAADNVDQQLTKSEMDDILEKADNMQNSLMNKAVDLRKDVEDIRSQRTAEIHANDEKNIDDKSLSSSKTKDSSSLDDVTTENSTESSQSNDSQLQKKQSQDDDNTLEHQEDEKIKEIIREETPMPLEDNKETMETSTPDKLTNENSKSSSSENENSQIKNDSTSASETVISTNENLENIVIDKLEKKLESTESLTNDEIKNETQSELEKIDEEKNFDDKPLDAHHNESSGSEKSSKNSHNSRPSTGKTPRKYDEEKKPKKSTSKSSLFDENCENEKSSNQSAIIAVIQSPEWDDEDEQVAKEISDVVGDNAEPDTDDPDDEDEDDSLGVVRVLPSTSDEGSTPSTPPKSAKNKTSAQADRRLIGSPVTFRPSRKQRRDSGGGGGGGGGRDSGIEPSPRVSKIPKRNIKCYPNTKKQQALNMETITRDVSINLRRYHLERKIFFQLMELKRLQIRHGQTNENVLVKRQVEAFHKAGMAGPALGVARYDQPLTFKNFEGFLYEQLRRLQRRPPSPDWCTDAKQCTLKTHRCHHATSAYTSVPIYTYHLIAVGGGDQERGEGTFFPKIETRARGQMTVEFTKGDEKQIISLPAEKLDRTKRYYVAFTVRGDENNQDDIKTPRNNAQRNLKSV